MAMGPYLSIITLNVNGLNAPTKRQRLSEWIQRQLSFKDNVFLVPSKIIHAFYKFKI